MVKGRISQNVTITIKMKTSPSIYALLSEKMIKVADIYVLFYGNMIKIIENAQIFMLCWVETWLE